MGTLIIKMPSRTAADQVEHWIELPCAYAYPTPDGGVEREGIKPLSALATEIGIASRLVLMIAASDVTVLRIKVPPASNAQLQRALPSLVEDQILSEPSECVIVASPVEGGWCTVAVMQRIWLELLSRTVNAYGAASVIAVPAQLCLMFEADVTVAAMTADEQELILKTELHDGFGIPMELIHSRNPDLVAGHALESIDSMRPGERINLYVQQHRLQVFQSVLEQMPELLPRVTLIKDDWLHWIKGIGRVEMNLLAGAFNAASPHRRDWRSTRLLYALTVLALLTHIIGLNIEVWNMQQEADRMRAGLMQTYRSTFPQDKVIIDPFLQMQRRIADAGRGTGNPAPDDFLALLARFGDAWSDGRPEAVVAPALAGLAYRDRSLMVALQPGNKAAIEKLQGTLSAQGLSVSQTSADVWQIGSKP